MGSTHEEERHQTEVPDRLALEERAELAVNGLTVPTRWLRERRYEP